MKSVLKNQTEAKKISTVLIGNKKSNLSALPDSLNYHQYTLKTVTVK